jgi:putative spermidine/putrescine transport system substrate-binding protein
MADGKQGAARRRGAVIGLLAAALAALAPPGALAQQKTLYVGMNGGDMERAFTQHVFPDFEPTM